MTILPNSTCGTITGTAWRKVRTYTTWASSEQTVTDIYKGPYSQLSTAYSYLFNTVQARSITPSVSDGSAVASITLIRGPSTWTYGSSPLDGEVKEPTFEVYPVTQTLDIRTMFLVSGASAEEIQKIDNAIRDGTIADLDVSGFFTATQKYRIWRMHGVEQFERTSFNLRVQRYFANITRTPLAFATDYDNVQKVFTWSAIRTLGQGLPSFVKEPKTTGRWNGDQELHTSNFSSASLSWKLSNLGVQYQGKWISLVWDFQGAHAWGADFYDGGTWVPTL
jgi:hypothetical protein